MNFVEQVKNGLLDLIKEMSSVSWLFVKNPGTDFSQKRKLDFVNTLWCMSSMESGDLKGNYWNYLVFDQKLHL